MTRTRTARCVSRRAPQTERLDPHTTVLSRGNGIIGKIGAVGGGTLPTYHNEEVSFRGIAVSASAAARPPITRCRRGVRKLRTACTETPDY